MKLKNVAKSAANDIKNALDSSLSKEELNKVTAIIAEAMEQSVNKVTRRSIACCDERLNPETDLAHQIRKELKLKQDAIITNLSSLR